MLTMGWMIRLWPLLFAVSALADTQRPKLILTLVFDQFRGDYLSRFEHRFLPDVQSNGELGGFEYLMKHGAYYPYGEYDISQSMTGPGHATILTGAYPYLNGIPSNLWFDRTKRAKVYCAEDAAFTTVTSTAQETQETNDPHIGTSPKNMNSTTVGDELKNAGYPSRVVTVALKDRAAILMGGHRADLALWFDPKAQEWVSSRFYLPGGKLPEWMLELDTEVKKHRNEPYVWKAEGKSSLVTDETHGTQNFRRETKKGTRESFAMPYGGDLTEQAAEAAFENFKLGQGRATDLMAVSFSSHDYAGHAFGPNSREMEEMTVAEDRQVSKFLNFVRKRVPLKDTIIVLTGDHGIPPSPDWLIENRVDAGRLSDAEFAKTIESAMDEKFGKPSKPWLGFYHDFDFFFDPDTLLERNISLQDAETESKKRLVDHKGTAFVLASLDLEAGRLPPGMHGRQAAKTYYPGRSADITIIPKPFYMKDEDTVDHLTGYNYDRIVPILMAGFGIRPGLYSRHAEVVDIAPTLTFLSGTIPPSLSEGRVLFEALKSEREPQ
jgi:predicted AlkP superfamily pyrophosphatase or phosphodiesterase